jgi:hypothetical protein
MTVDDYLGRVTKPNPNIAPPPPELVTAHRDAIDHAIAIARARLAKNPRDADAHLSTRRGGGPAGVVFGNRRRYGHERVSLSTGSVRRARTGAVDRSRPARTPDSSSAPTATSCRRSPCPFASWPTSSASAAAASAAFISSKKPPRTAVTTRWMRASRWCSCTTARSGYDDALKQLQTLRDRFPRNRLLWLEMGSTQIRAGRYADAERILTEGMSKFAGDTRPRMFGEDALWFHKRGTARAWRGQNADAEADLKRALSLEARKWVYGRSHLELGRLALKKGDRTAAGQEFQAAITLCESDNDPLAADEARRLMK